METAGTGREKEEREREREREREKLEGVRIASIDYEARLASLMADSDIYRVNGRRASIPT